jgi:hypothetical protein
MKKFIFILNKVENLKYILDSQSPRNTFNSDRTPSFFIKLLRYFFLNSYPDADRRSHSIMFQPGFATQLKGRALHVEKRIKNNTEHNLFKTIGQNVSKRK